MIMKNVRQEIVWVPPGRKIQVLERPKRVWTLFSESKPELPFTPIHNHNAFLEDFLHDWNMVNATTLRYYSRVALDSVWILLEYP